MTMRRTPAATAHLILINGKLYECERDREITRYRFSLQTLRRLAGRSALRDRFLSDLEDELAELGWLLIPLGSEFAVMDMSKIDNWVKLSSKRLAEVQFLDKDEEDIEQAYVTHFPAPSEFSTEAD